MCSLFDELAKNFKKTTKLKELTYLGAVIPNVTRWLGKFEMYKRYFCIEDSIKKLEDLDIYITSASMRRHLVSAKGHFEKFQSISTNLQKESLLVIDDNFILNHV